MYILGISAYYHDSAAVLIMRFFSTVGERQTGQYGMVIPRFVTAALKGEPLNIYGNGKPSRCFAYTHDVIDGVIALVNDSSSFGNVYNIGSVEEVSIEDLAIKIKKMTGSSSDIKYISYEKAYGQAFDDLKRRVLCLERIQKQVGYKPRISLGETLKRKIQSDAPFF